MSVVAAAVITTAVVGYASSQSQAKAIKKSGDAQAQVQYEALQFDKQRYNRWKSIYGELETNLGNFYKGLSPDTYAAQGLQTLEQSFSDQIGKLNEMFAQEGVSAGAKAELLTGATLQHAKDKATTRFEAPFKVAEQQSNFLALGLGQGDKIANNITNDMKGVGEAKAGKQAALANMYGQEANAAYGAAGDLAYLYFQNKALNKTPVAGG